MMYSRSIQKNVVIFITLLFLSSSPNNALGETGVDGAKNYIDETRAQKGHVPLPEELLAFINELEPRVGQEEFATIADYWSSVQRPPINAENLSEIIEAKRESIFDLKLEYNSSAFNRSSDGKMIPDEENERNIEYFSSGDKILSKEKGGSKINAEIRRAFDGQTEFLCKLRHDALKHGEIRKFRGREFFYREHHPLKSCMLLDSKRDLNMDHKASDLALMLKEGGYVHEKKFIINGEETILVSYGFPPLFSVYLSPEKNYAVVRFEENSIEYNFSDPTGKIATRLRFTRDYEDFVDLGNGIWLPKTIVSQRYAKSDNKNGLKVGELVEKSIIKCKTMEINKGINESVFTDIFPLGTRVFDKIANITYTHGSPKEVDAVLDDLIAEIRSSEIEESTEQNEQEGMVAESTPYVAGDEHKKSKSTNYILTILIILTVIVFLLFFLLKKGKIRPKL